MSAEGPATARLLWEAGRVYPRPDAVRSALDDQQLDIDELVSLASSHGLGPLLWKALGAAESQERLGPRAMDLATEAAWCRHQALVVMPEAVATAVRPLLDARLEPLVFKGPTVASRYPAPGLRPMGDIDLIVPAEDHARGLAAMCRAGWVVVRPDDRHHYETVLVHESVPGMLAELHRGLDVWYQRPNRLRARTLWRRRVAIDCAGTPAFGLTPEDEVVALAAHAGKPFHYFTRLIWSVDLAMIDSAASASGRGLDWDLVLHLADSWQCRTVVAVALAQAARLGVDVPAPLLELPRSKVRRSALTPLIAADWPVSDRDLHVKNRLKYALVDRWPRRLVLLAGAPAPAPPWRWPREWARQTYFGLRRASRLRRRHSDAPENAVSRPDASSRHRCPGGG